MSIGPTSRYANGVVTRMPDGTGTFNLSVLRTVPRSRVPYSLYVWQSGDRPDLLAKSVYGDPSLWWVIFDANPQVLYPLNVPVGTVIRIPTGPPNGKGTLLQ